MKPRGRPRHPDVLTPREWQVLELLRAGHSNKAVADAIGITERGVKYHVSEILGKLGVTSRWEAIEWAEGLDRRRSLPVVVTWGLTGAAVLVLAGLLLVAFGVFRASDNDAVANPVDEVDEACASGGDPDTEWDFVTSLEEAVRRSQIVILGRPVRMSRTELMAGYQISTVRNRYSVEVEKFLKGGANDTLALAFSIAYRIEGLGLSCLDGPRPLVIGDQYLFFLEPIYTGEWVGVGTPDRYHLVDGKALPEGPQICCNHAINFTEYLPETSEAELLSALSAD